MDNAEQYIKIIEALGDVKNDLSVGIAKLETRMDELLGAPGKPGRIQGIEADVKEVTNKVQELEQSTSGLRWKVGTVSSIGGAAVMFAAQWVMKKIFHF